MASSLDSDHILSLATSLLPSTSPALTTPTEAAALVIHTIHGALGFRLVRPAPAEGPNATANALPEGWANGGTPKLCYRHEQSSLEFVVSVVELGGRAMVAAVAVEDNKSVSFDLLLTDYFSLSAFPFSPPSSLSALFSSPTRLTDLITLYRLNILQPLIPGLRKEGYSELPASTSSSTPSASGIPVGGRGGYYPDTGGPMGPYGGGVPQPPRRFPEGERQPNPFPSVGRSDLDPLGGQVPHFAGFPGTQGPTVGPPGGGGNGMFVGPDHPLFRERFGAPEQGGVWGGDEWLPRGAVPPGARFDPIGPGNGPPQPGGVGIGGFGGGRGIGSFYPGRGGGGGGRGGGGMGRGGMDPDPDEFYPPGNGTGNNRNGGSSEYDNMFG